MNIHQLRKDYVLPTIHQIQIVLSDAEFGCQGVYFQKRALIWRASFPCFHRAAPEEEGYRMILGLTV